MGIKKKIGETKAVIGVIMVYHTRSESVQTKTEVNVLLSLEMEAEK